MVATASPGARASIVTTAIGNKPGNREPGIGNGAARIGRRFLLLGSRVWRSPSNPAVGILPPAFSRARDAPGIAQTRGFTLIEMLAVIVLLAIGATITAVSLHGRGRGELNTAAQSIAAGLRDTRTRAMAHGQPEWFTLDLQTHTYEVPGRDPRGLPAAATLQATTAAVGKQVPGIARIGYFPDGSSSGGHIVLSENRRALRVDVDWLTGAVTITDKVADQ